MTALESLEANFREALGLPEDAVRWLLDLYEVIQVYDDIVDGDQLDRKYLDLAIHKALVDMPNNAFYVKHSAKLAPVMSNAVMKWKASDTVERSKEASATSFVWRASYYDVILTVVTLIHGVEKTLENAHLVLKLYGENYEDYKKEFSDA